MVINIFSKCFSSLTDSTWNSCEWIEEWLIWPSLIIVYIGWAAAAFIQSWNSYKLQQTTKEATMLIWSKS